MVGCVILNSGTHKYERFSRNRTVSCGWHVDSNPHMTAATSILPFFVVTRLTKTGRQTGQRPRTTRSESRRCRAQAWDSIPRFAWFECRFARHRKKGFSLSFTILLSLRLKMYTNRLWIILLYLLSVTPNLRFLWFLRGYQVLDNPAGAVVIYGDGSSYHCFRPPRIAQAFAGRRNDVRLDLDSNVLLLFSMYRGVKASSCFIFMN
jgi:hypothetical protein